MELLTDGDRLSPAYRKVLAIVEERLTQARTKNEGDLDLNQTNRVRGRILELKYLTRMLTEDAVPTPPAD